MLKKSRSFSARKFLSTTKKSPPKCWNSKRFSSIAPRPNVKPPCPKNKQRRTHGLTHSTNPSNQNNTCPHQHQISINKNPPRHCSTSTLHMMSFGQKSK